MKILISQAMADTVDRANHDDRAVKRQEHRKKTEVLEKMKDLLGNLREKYQKATQIMKHSIQQQMVLIKKRFNKIYEELHGEPYYSVSSSDALSLEPLESLSGARDYPYTVQEIMSDFEDVVVDLAKSFSTRINRTSVFEKSSHPLKNSSVSVTDAIAVIRSVIANYDGFSTRNVGTDSLDIAVTFKGIGISVTGSISNGYVVQGSMHILMG